ncbi:MAG: polysaccharide pyruvyl transferase family protein [Planctomycetia bacterium]|nr:polysaccharide pyruvyl transferase family protein [Planctomycetia bacterium]
MTPFPRALPRPTAGGTISVSGVVPACEHLFNPTVFRSSTGLVSLFRGVSADGVRRVFRCGLAEDFRPTEPPADWTAELAARGEAPPWVADPRTFSFQGRRFVTFNTGHSRRPNDLFVAEVDEAGRPTAAPIAAHLTTGRRMIEKNWGFFPCGDQLFAIYALDPLLILACTFDGDRLICEPAWRHDWLADHLRAAFGPLHGGTCPMTIGERLVTVFQSRWRAADGFEYAGNMLELQPEPPFAPLSVGPWPLFTLDEREREIQPSRRLNSRVAHCLYPAGLIAGPGDGRLSITYGINDAACGYRSYDAADVLARLVPLTRIAGVRTLHTLPSASASASPTAPASRSAAVRTFHWRPRAALFGTPAELASGRFMFGNVGDSLQRHLTAALFGMRTLHAEHAEPGTTPRLLGAGSIAHRARGGDVIWGSGFKDQPLSLTSAEKAAIEVRAVRGPLTAEYLARNGVAVPPDVSFFDPGLLVAEILPDEIAACRRSSASPSGLLLVPHYKDTAVWLDRFAAAGHRLRTVDCDLYVMLREILAAELVVSSSLHGIILAEALGVPALLMRPPATEPFAKFEDYYLGTGRTAFPVIDDPGEAARVRPAEPAKPPQDWRRSVPTIHDLESGGFTVPILALDAPISCPAGMAQGLVEIGRFAGGRFDIRATLAGPGAARLVFSIEGDLLQDVALSTETATLTFDGRLLEERGGLVLLTATPAGGNALRILLTPEFPADERSAAAGGGAVSGPALS